MMNIKIKIVAVALATAFFVAADWATPLVAHAALDRIVAVVDNDPITDSELRAAIGDMVREMRQRKRNVPAEDVLRRQTLNQLIRERVLTQEADRRGVRVKGSEVDNAMLTIARRNNLSARDFREALSKEGINFDVYRESIAGRLRVQRMIDREVSRSVEVLDDEVDLQLQSQGTGADAGAEFDLSRILISVPQGASAADAELARGRAELVLERIKQDFAFEDAAAEFSQAPEALEGGRLGWRKAGQLPALYLGALVGMKAGEVSDPIRGPNGFHLLKLNARRSSDQKIVTQYELNQILMRPSVAASEDVIIEKLIVLRERLLQGESFETIAAAHTEDPVSQNSGGLVGWVALAELTEEMGKIVPELKPGEISQPVRSPFGYHLIKITGQRKQDVTEEFRRNAARQEIFTRKSEEFYDDWVRQLRDRAYVEYRE